MSKAADEILQAGIRDAKTALLTMQELDRRWKLFTAACEGQQPDLAAMRGRQLVELIESAVDLYLSSYRRIAQFIKLTQEADYE